MSAILTLLIVVLIVGLLFGGFSFWGRPGVYPGPYFYGGGAVWFIVLIVLLILLLGPGRGW